MLAALIIGFGLGASVAAQLGPISLLAIRSTLRNGIAVGLAIGAGVAVIDTLYAAAGAGAGAGRGRGGERPAARGGGRAWCGGRQGLGAGPPRRGRDRGRRAALPRRQDALVRVPDPDGRRGARGARDAALRVRHHARRDRLE